MSDITRRDFMKDVAALGAAGFVSSEQPTHRAMIERSIPRSNERLPVVGVDAAKLLVEERKVGAVGLDTPSIDYGPSTDFMVHRVVYGANIPGFENLASLDQLPPTGAIVIALLMKIEGGSGGPLRAVALIRR